MEHDSQPERAHPRAQKMSTEFLHWITIARELVADHFPSERTEPHNALVINTARTLMLADRLGEIDTTLEGIQSALENAKEA